MNILVVIDHIPQYAQAFVTPSQIAWVVAETLWDKFSMHYGLPEKIPSDQGCNFKSKLIAELCELSQTKKLQNTPYRPQCNGQCECFNMTLISMIGTLPTETIINWQEQLPTLVHAYKCSPSNATGFSPFYLMFGRHPMLSFDVKFGVRTPDIVASTSHGYIKKLQRRLDWAYKTASEVNKRESKNSKKQYDQKVKCTKFEPIDLVLVRQEAFKGKHKITP